MREKSHSPCGEAVPMQVKNPAIMYRFSHDNNLKIQYIIQSTARID